MLREYVHESLLSLLHLERRYEPFWRPQVCALLREPAATLVQALIELGRRREDVGLCEERYLPGEDEAFDSIVADMGEFMRRKYRPGEYERGGNTKTHGLVRAEVEIRADLPSELRHGIFQEARRFPAWIRFAGPGPDSPPDIEDIGVLSMSVKLMGVPGPKLLNDEKHTQDLLGVSTPTFVTGTVLDNAQLQAQVRQQTPLYYFLDPRRPHLLDLLMQALWSETQTSPLECRYHSCVPYLLGQGRAMQYSMRPELRTRRRVPNLPGRPPDHYLRDAMVQALGQGDVRFELLIQPQTDGYSMPIENAAVRWSERRSPPIVAATIRIPQQRFDSPAQLRFAGQLRFTPWHCLTDHRPLGNLNRARRRLYSELARLRQTQNQVQHYEPTGSERFEDSVAESTTVSESMTVPKGTTVSESMTVPKGTASEDRASENEPATRRTEPPPPRPAHQNGTGKRRSWA